MEISVSVLCEGCGATPYQPINTAKPYVLAFLTSDDHRIFESPVFADVRPLCELGGSRCGWMDLDVVGRFKMWLGSSRCGWEVLDVVGWF